MERVGWWCVLISITQLAVNLFQIGNDKVQLAPRSGSGGGIRTHDLQVMSLASYRAALPRVTIHGHGQVQLVA